MAHDRPSGAGVRARRTTGLAGALMWIAGLVDAVGFILLSRVFTANMSGNAIHFGMEWGHGQWSRGATRIVAIAAFFAGGMVAEVLHEAGRRRSWPSRGLAATLVAEGVILVAFVAAAAVCLGWDAGRSANGSALFGLIALGAAAMGAQNASLRRAGRIRIHTTHITGELTQVSREVVERAYAWSDRRHGRPPPARGGPALAPTGTPPSKSRGMRRVYARQHSSTTSRPDGGAGPVDS